MSRVAVAVVVAVAVILGSACTSNTTALDALCTDVRQATQQGGGLLGPAYSHQLWEAMQRDAQSPGDDGYSASQAAITAYLSWGNTRGLSRGAVGRDEFLSRASVFLEGWCGGA